MASPAVASTSGATLGLSRHVEGAFEPVDQAVQILGRRSVDCPVGMELAPLGACHADLLGNRGNLGLSHPSSKVLVRLAAGRAALGSFLHSLSGCEYERPDHGPPNF